MFNLPPPPGFRGLDEHKPVTAYYRNLPHWRQAGATYFVTFRLADALPQEKLRLVKELRLESERTHPLPRSERDWEEYAREVTRRTEAWLDEGYGACHFAQRLHAVQLEEAIMHFQSVRYFVSSWVVMPNHCHLIICPYEGWALEDILQGMKGVVANRVNKARGGTGSIWQEESYDRIVRDEEHLWRVIQYIGSNPFRAGIPRQHWRRWIDPAWQPLGWFFVKENEGIPLDGKLLGDSAATLQ